MSAPRVLVSGVVLSQPMGGVRRHNQELLPRVAERLTRVGGSLSVLAGAEGLPFPLPASIEVLPSSVPARPALARATLEGRSLRRVIAEAQSAGKPFDLLHTAHLPVPQRLPVPYTLTLHDLRNLAGAHTPMSRRLIARKVVGAAVEHARAVITVSESVRGELLARFRLDPARVHVVPNAADHFAPLPRAPGAALVHVGHVEPRKNLEVVVRALAHDPELPPLELWGAPKNAEDERLTKLARELGVLDRVHFRGPFEDAQLPQLYANAACIVLPSRLEGFGISALEAQRARAPLAIARIPALVEVAGTSVPSFAPDDPAECASAIRAALATPANVLDEHADAAARFTWDRSADLLTRAWLG